MLEKVARLFQGLVLAPLQAVKETLLEAAAEAGPSPEEDLLEGLALLAALKLFEKNKLGLV